MMQEDPEFAAASFFVMKKSLLGTFNRFNKSAETPAATILQLFWPAGSFDKFLFPKSSNDAVFDLPYILLHHCKRPPQKNRRRVKPPPQGWKILYCYCICSFAMEEALRCPFSVGSEFMDTWKKGLANLVENQLLFSSSMRTAQALFLLDFFVDCSADEKLMERFPRTYGDKLVGDLFEYVSCIIIFLSLWPRSPLSF